MLRPTALVVVPLLLLGPGCTTKAELSTPELADGAGATTASPRVGAERNETDEAYVHELSAMHQQAISMSVMVANKQVPASLRDLAVEIGESRSEELRDLTGILARWDVKPHGADFHGNPGELTSREMSDLYGLDGEQFEERWLDRMAANHRTAVAMSEAEVDRGLNLALRELARRMVRVQGEQLDALEGLAAE